MFLLSVKEEFTNDISYDCCINTNNIKKFLEENLNYILIREKFKLKKLFSINDFNNITQDDTYIKLNFICTIRYAAFVINITPIDFFKGIKEGN